MDNKQIEALINETLPTLAADMAEEMVEVLTKTLHGGKDSLNLDTIYNIEMFKTFVCCVSDLMNMNTPSKAAEKKLLNKLLNCLETYSVGDMQRFYWLCGRLESTDNMNFKKFL